MKKTIITLLTAFQMMQISDLNAQLKAGAQGIFIKAGTTFSTDGLFIVPENATVIAGNDISRRSLAVTGPRMNGIQRLYEFARPIPFQGMMGMYFHHEELNGNDPATLILAFSKAPSTHYTDYSVIEGSLVNREERSIGHSSVNMPLLSNVTAITPFVMPGNYAAIKPNNFLTPNGDGVNDFWVIKDIENFPNNELKIFDRSGRVVHKVIGYNNKWDGTIDGRPLPEDSYYFILSLDTGKEKITGFISLIRKE